MSTRKLGFVDYRLDNFHANVFLDLVRGELKSRRWEVTRCWDMDPASGGKWAESKGISYVTEISQMRDCDGFMILAPSNPEVHLEMARRVFPLQRPTYVDKTFAPDHKTAKAILRLADKYGVPVFTTSALRCASSLNRLLDQLCRENIRHLRAWGGGRSFREYAIHPLEMVIAAMGPEVRQVMHLAQGEHHELNIRFSRGRTASVFVHLNAACDFQAVVSTRGKTVHVSCKDDPIFRDLCSLVLDFLEQGKEPVDRRESLTIFKVLDAAFSKKAIGKLVKV
jgi:predicted dehydrogenase